MGWGKARRRPGGCGGGRVWTGGGEQHVQSARAHQFRSLRHTLTNRVVTVRVRQEVGVGGRRQRRRDAEPIDEAARAGDELGGEALVGHCARVCVCVCVCVCACVAAVEREERGGARAPCPRGRRVRNTTLARVLVFALSFFSALRDWRFLSASLYFARLCGRIEKKKKSPLECAAVCTGGRRGRGEHAETRGGRGRSQQRRPSKTGRVLLSGLVESRLPHSPGCFLGRVWGGGRGGGGQQLSCKKKGQTKKDKRQASVVSLFDESKNGGLDSTKSEARTHIA